MLAVWEGFLELRWVRRRRGREQGGGRRERSHGGHGRNLDEGEGRMQESLRWIGRLVDSCWLPKTILGRVKRYPLFSEEKLSCFTCQTCLCSYSNNASVEHLSQRDEVYMAVGIYTSLLVILHIQGFHDDN